MNPRLRKKNILLNRRLNMGKSLCKLVPDYFYYADGFYTNYNALSIFSQLSALNQLSMLYACLSTNGAVFRSESCQGYFAAGKLCLNRYDEPNPHYSFHKASHRGTLYKAV